MYSPCHEKPTGVVLDSTLPASGVDFARGDGQFDDIAQARCSICARRTRRARASSTPILWPKPSRRSPRSTPARATRGRPDSSVPRVSSVRRPSDGRVATRRHAAHAPVARATEPEPLDAACSELDARPRRRGALTTAVEQLQSTFAATIRDSNTNRLGLFGSIVALTQWLLRAPKVSTRVKFATTPPFGPLRGLSILK